MPKKFELSPEVIRLESSRGKRKYTTLSIPESVALGVHERLGHEALQAELAARNPLCIVRFGNLHAGVAEKTRNVLKLETGKELANRKRISKAMGTAIQNATPGT
jgi:hypothetical protein